jgi:alkylated DNA repair dioxygenase AlkB
VIQHQLFTAGSSGPEGLEFAADFLSVEDEVGLLQRITQLPLAQAQYKEWQAHRRVVSFGGSYDFSANELRSAPPIPEFLAPLRSRLAAWAGVAEAQIQQAMVAEYRPGTQLGWHRDVPDFEEIMAVSLRGAARLRLRPWPPRKGARALFTLDLPPRCAYLLRGVARWQWQHAISPTKELRYSITFRTKARAQSN